MIRIIIILIAVGIAAFFVRSGFKSNANRASIERGVDALDGTSSRQAVPLRPQEPGGRSR